ncbi:hypothetical protein F442_15048 [Phytophthora nicotianae P10297]|uniref:Uncharacterized protein n=1 Tax=Phytophthora nicotianae P10297 TaxID=1317064 RepID=W2YQL1_PHYNI|nr:hypothetical protein F442_15048 [Phytophthora nicotianae P10297]
MFSEWTFLARYIVAGVERATQQSICRPTTQEEVDCMYREGIANVPMKMPAHPEKQRPERAVTTPRRMRQAIHDSNPEARAIPFRRRKAKERVRRELL